MVMKSVIISDIHFGVRGDSNQFLDNYQLFFEKCFFPFLKENNIKHIYDLGDVFDNRKKIDTNTLFRAKQMYFNRLEKMGVKVDIIVGNHCCHYRNTNRVNSPSMVLGDYQNITIHDTAIEIGDVILIPWINKENYDLTFKMIKETSCSICMGHFEFTGFNFNKKQVAKTGISTKEFNKFDLVLSGHYHTRSTKGNITYVGSPTQHTWIDAGDIKGFHVLDNKKLTFIENPYTIFENVSEDDINDHSIFKNKFVRVFNNSDKDINNSIALIEKVCYDVKVVDNFKLEKVDVGDEIIEVQDTWDLIEQYVNQMNDIDNEGVLAILNQTYKESL